MIPVAVLILFGGAIWLLRNKISSSIFLTEEGETPLPSTKVRGENPWYKRLQEATSNHIDVKVLWHTDWFPATLGFLFLYIVLTWQFYQAGNPYRDWWWNNFVATLWFPVILAGFVLFGKMLGSRKPFKPVLAKWGLIIMTLLVIVHFFNSRWLPKIKPKSAGVVAVSPLYAGWKAYASSKSARNYAVTDSNKEVADVVITFWKKNLEDDEAEKMILTCYLESGFRQFEEDGETPLRGRENPKDVGVCQINEDFWLKKPAEIKGEAEPWDTDGTLKAEYDFGTLEGNLNSSLWIYKNYGGEKWNTYDYSNALEIASRGKEVVRVIASVGIPGELVETPGYDVSVWPMGPIWVYRKNGPRVAIDKGDATPLGTSPWFRFQSRTDEAILVIVIK